MSVLPSHDPARTALLSAARGCSPDVRRQCHALLALVDTCQALSQWLRRDLARSNLTEPGFRLLAHVIGHAPADLTPSEISTELGLPRQLIAATLGRLEVSGLVARERNAHDRRTFTLKATPKGRRVFSAALQHCLRAIGRIMSPLEPQELVRLDHLCAQLRENSLQTASR